MKIANLQVEPKGKIPKPTHKNREPIQQTLNIFPAKGIVIPTFCERYSDKENKTIVPLRFINITIDKNQIVGEIPL